MRTAAASFALLVGLLGAGPAPAQPPSGGHPPSADPQPWNPLKPAARDRQVSGALRTEKLPPGLLGRAAFFPIGKAEHDLLGLLYVPGSYDPAHTWPVLVEGVMRGRLGRALVDFREQAEKHGFLLLAVEYLYFRGDDAGQEKAWSRQGEITVQHKSRRGDEFLADMAVDERILRDLLKQLDSAYTIEKRAVGVTGFLGAGLMAYRLPMAYPGLFCAGISRSGGFAQHFMPTVTAKARQRPFYIIFGEKEDPKLTLNDSVQARVFLESQHFKKVVAERIPNSGVDSRPEIAANYFRSAVDDLLGPSRAEFDRLAVRASRFLAGDLPDDVRLADGRPPDAASLAEALEDFAVKHPRSPQVALGKFLTAQLLLKAPGRRQEAERLLRQFDKLPLVTDAVAPRALLLLVEKVVDVEADPYEAKRLLRRIIARRTAPKATRQRAHEMLLDLNRRTRPRGE
jgi:hypothetical protein